MRIGIRGLEKDQTAFCRYTCDNFNPTLIKPTRGVALATTLTDVLDNGPMILINTSTPGVNKHIHDQKWGPISATDVYELIEKKGNSLHTGITSIQVNPAYWDQVRQTREKNRARSTNPDAKNLPLDVNLRTGEKLDLHVSKDASILPKSSVLYFSTYFVNVWTLFRAKDPGRFWSVYTRIQRLKSLEDALLGLVNKCLSGYPGPANARLNDFLVPTKSSSADKSEEPDRKQDVDLVLDTMQLFNWTHCDTLKRLRRAFPDDRYIARLCGTTTRVSCREERLRNGLR
jgi:hypothetical protein